jgi:hypothetical protein
MTFLRFFWAASRKCLERMIERTSDSVMRLAFIGVS